QIFDLEYQLPVPRVRIPSLSAAESAILRSLEKNRKYCACSRSLFDLRASENLSFGQQQLIIARFSLSRIEAAPLRARQVRIGSLWGLPAALALRPVPRLDLARVR